MNLTVNGKPATIDGETPVSITILLKALQVEQREYVTVEVNGDIMDRGEFEATTVKDGDSVEFLYFMGGGR
ncbi:sulfur carrier protein ThiS [Geomonas subterranea]|uniref:Sulfur carrier protein ThiS n=1 Tax=Geomonas subterranea TaxID=2847989 RepID=A0ABX8LP97_9BACT|nr:sulfur carrier protein ThiS [Geomonas subterranea]QXE92139.1 sulfur carrier protein ThiS [Geomonas subterranea]QXM09763.1 sulfur carrier protein ThiS [Geomonas subterranea]